MQVSNDNLTKKSVRENLTSWLFSSTRWSLGNEIEPAAADASVPSAASVVFVPGAISAPAVCVPAPGAGAAAARHPAVHHQSTEQLVRPAAGGGRD